MRAPSYGIGVDSELTAATTEGITGRAMGSKINT